MINPSAQEQARPDVEDPNPLIGKELVEGLLIMDKGPWLDDLKKELRPVHFGSDAEKIAWVSKVTKGHLKDAINAKDNPEEYAAHKDAIDTAWADTPVGMQQLVDGGYGVCRDFHGYGLVAFEELGMEAVFYGNSRYRHTFLYVKNNGVWQVFDPFAEAYFKNKTGQEQLFPENCYKGEDVVLFGQTSKAKDLPKLVSSPVAPPLKPSNPGVTTIDALKSRAQQLRGGSR